MTDREGDCLIKNVLSAADVHDEDGSGLLCVYRLMRGSSKRDIEWPMILSTDSDKFTKMGGLNGGFGEYEHSASDTTFLLPPLHCFPVI